MTQTISIGCVCHFILDRGHVGGLDLCLQIFNCFSTHRVSLPSPPMIGRPYPSNVKYD